jgi:EAL domain-containing protein (putative c-di-GMP-specific phosphodiesterase class I)/CHASE2 domain-containing sensor protein/GGDEF domain-containing protein
MSLRQSRGIMAAVIVAVLMALAWLTVHLPLDRALADLRFGHSDRSASGDIVFVDIDGATLDSVGVWPWPRSVHADLLGRLLDLGAHEIWVDIDFSAASTDAEDASLAAALEAAGGYVHLAAFQRAQGQSTILARPRPEFLAHANIFAVNAWADQTGIVRAIPAMIREGGQVIPSLPSAIAGTAGTGMLHTIDYGINAQTIPRVSGRAILGGTADPNLVAGRHVVLGTSALELKDIFFTPNQGPLPGAMVQILGAETALAGRNVQSVSRWWAVGLSLLVIGFNFALPITSTALRLATLVVASAAAEVVALALYMQGAIMVPTGLFHMAVAMVMVVTIVADTRFLSTLVRTIGGERDALRLMLEQVITDNYDGVLIAQSDGVVLSASRFAETFLGKVLVGAKLADILPAEIVAVAAILDDDQHSINGQTVTRTAQGRRDVEYVVTRSVLDGTQAILTVTFRDVTERSRAEARLRYLSEHDPATDTLTRAGFIKAVRETSGVSSVFVLELERFAVITASLGHDAGDLLLRQFAERLRDGRVIAIAHLGKAQYAVATVGNDSPDELFAAFAQSIKHPFDLDGHKAKVGLSAGCAPIDRNEEPDMWLRWAEAALLSIEDRNLGRLAIYDGTHTWRVARNRTLESHLTQALSDGQFFLQYQPQVDLATGRMVGAEALLRWRRGDDIVPPCEFLPISEETGMIVDMTRWILVEACQTALGWHGDMRVAVNISALHFELGDLVSDVACALKATGLPASRLEIEITETAAMSGRGNAIAVLAALRAMGVTVAIDDFGTGQSSLAYLDHLPFDILKIDKAFIDKLDTPDAPRGIIEGIIGIAKSMNKRVLADGVETARQADLLKSLGCEFGQGYHWSRPIDGMLIGQQAA